ncbi:MAG: hypothetical protein EZS28_029595 [Streblomastix strix]|uniref:Uncharacterized protein n=1 Tax=Streblomastix strix TaxID=222440 RepID=A0A5J4UWQ7_9EUKA|nr:MAG: hypothetical protein EZS28_029595 [Streblomastix strix]
MTTTASKFDEDIETGKILSHPTNSCRLMRKIEDITLEGKKYINIWRSIELERYANGISGSMPALHSQN